MGLVSICLYTLMCIIHTSSSMNRFNVWSLADVGNCEELREVIQRTPSCVNVCGWSYAAGKRRGVLCWGGVWTIDAANHAVPAPILHYATVRGSLECVVVCLEAGASADAQVNGVTADVIAQGLGRNDIADVIRLAKRRQDDPIGVLEESEERERKFCEVNESTERQKLLDQLRDGIVSAEVTFRSQGITSRFFVSIPRFVGYARVVEKIEEICKQRVLISFCIPPARLPSTRDSPTKDTMGTSSLSISQLQTLHGQQSDRHVELNPRTTERFLHLKHPKCTARPLVEGLGELSLVMCLPPEERSPSTLSSHGNAALHRSNDASSPQPRPKSRNELVSKLEAVESGPNKIEEMKRMLLDIERPKKAGKKLTAEQREAAMTRLYTRCLATIREKKEAYAQYCEEGQKKLLRSDLPTHALSAEEEASVQRLYGDALSRKAEVINTAEERVQARVERPPQHTLTREEADEASTRLFRSSESKVSALKLSEQRAYCLADESSAPSSPVDFDATVKSVYYAAVQKKKDAIDKLTKKFGDFRTKLSPPKHLTPDEVKQVADRLCKPKGK